MHKFMHVRIYVCICIHTNIPIYELFKQITVTHSALGVCLDHNELSVSIKATSRTGDAT